MYIQLTINQQTNELETTPAKDFSPRCVATPTSV